MGLSSRVGPQWFSIGCFIYNINNFFTLVIACAEVVFEFEWWATCFGLLRAKLILTPLGMSNWVWPLTNWYRISFNQPFTLPLNIHQNLTEHRRCCMPNNQPLTKSHIEIENNSLMCIGSFKTWVDVYELTNYNHGHPRFQWQAFHITTSRAPWRHVPSKMGTWNWQTDLTRTSVSKHYSTYWKKWDVIESVVNIVFTTKTRLI
jgi:hypothetical protein